MNTKHIFLTSVISLAAAGAMADDITIDSTPTVSTVTRAQVKAEVLKARKAGGLLAAGEAISQGAPIPFSTNVSRAEVKSQVVAARASGELLPAGEGIANGVNDNFAGSTLARADVKAQVLAARQAGELLPAGEIISVAQNAQSQSVHASNPFKALAKVVRGDRDNVTQ